MKQFRLFILGIVFLFGLVVFWVGAQAAAFTMTSADDICASVTEVPQEECEALVALYDSAGGATWTNKSGWLSTATPCSWYGVRCSAGHVTALAPWSNQLSGSIPSELGNLANLTYLSLHGNELSGSIPPELGNLVNLTVLYLGENELSGSIPRELGNLVNLTLLSLYGNELSGSIPPELGNLVNLREFYLYWNQLTGSIPPELGNLDNLTVLNLGDNQLVGSIPPELGDMAKLKGLYLSENQLVGSIPPELGNLVNLTGLSLYWNQLTGSIPPELGNLDNLTYLSLGYNQLVGSIPPELGNLVNLTVLHLGVNELSGSIPPELGNLVNLTVLHLGDNQLVGSIPPELGNLAKLTGLHLGNNSQLSGSIPPELGDLANLTYLYLFNNQLSGGIPAELGDLVNLTGLDLYRNRLSGSIPITLGNLVNLRTLRLEYNALEGDIPVAIVNLVNLNANPGDSTDIGYNKLTASDAAVRAFLNGKDPDWSETQTVPPTDVDVVSESSNSVELAWTPIAYTGDSGYYEISYATTAGGPYTVHGTTSDKTAAGYTAGNLSPGTVYYFVVRTYTPAHWFQQNALWSAYSQEVSASLQRAEIDLNGTWQYAYSSVESPAPETDWADAEVPSFVDWRVNEPYIWFRRTFTLPPGFDTQRAYLDFQGIKYASQIYLNGTLLDEHPDGFTPFEVAIPEALLDETNELLIRVSDWRSALESQPLPLPVAPDSVNDALIYPVGSQWSQLGIWQDVKLVAYPGVCIQDVFVQTSVRDQEIELEVTLENLTAQARTVTLGSEVLDGSQVVLDFTAQVFLNPDETKVITLVKPWTDPHLWSPDDPHLYRLRSHLSSGDELMVRFGFREFWIEGSEFHLNGAPIHLRATAAHPLAFSKEEALNFLRQAKEGNNVIMRLHAQPWPSAWYEAADEVGMLLVWESAYWIGGATQKEPFWSNFEDHLQDLIRLRRNHPSIVIWSLENELLLGIALRGGQATQAEARLANLATFVRDMDLTRPIMFEGDGDPRTQADIDNGSLVGNADILNLHYPHEYPKPHNTQHCGSVADHRLWPDEAWWLEAVDRPIPTDIYPCQIPDWPLQKPLYIGEFLWVPPDHIEGSAIFFGDAIYRDLPGYQQQGKAKAWDYQIEAYRALGVQGISPWNIWRGAPEIPIPLLYNLVQEKFAPNGLYLREKNSRFFSGDPIVRSAYLFNDLLQESDLTVTWELKMSSVVRDAGSQAFHLQPAEIAPFTIQFQSPQEVGKATLSYRVERNTEEVFSYEETIQLSPRSDIQAGTTIYLYDPAGTTATALQSEGISYSSLTDLSSIPPAATLVIIGRDGLVDSDSWKRIRDFAAQGSRALILRQESYPRGAPLRLTTGAATIAFPRRPSHAVLAGIAEDELRLWLPDNLVIDKPLSRSDCGLCKVLIDAGATEGLKHVGLMELEVGNGTILFSQLDLLPKLGDEPAARILFQNILDYLAGYQFGGARRLHLLQATPEEERTLRAIGFDSDFLQQASVTSGGLIFDSGDLDGNLTDLLEQVNQGSVLWLHKPTNEVLSELATFGMNVSAQVALPGVVTVTDAPQAEGLTSYSLNWELPRVEANFADTSYAPDFTGATEIPHSDFTVTAELTEIITDHIVLFTNGYLETDLVVAAAGLYNLGLDARGTQAEGEFPAVRIQVNGETLGTVIGIGDQDVYHFTAYLPAGTSTLRIEFFNDFYNANVDPPDDRNLFFYKLQIAEASASNFIALTQPAALVEVPYGSGFVLLDGLNWETPGAPDRKEAFLVSLLDNLGVKLQLPSDYLVLEAEEMNIVSNDEQVVNKTDSGVFFGSNGTITDTVDFDDGGRYLFKILAGGNSYLYGDEKYPRFELKIDGQLVASQTLRADAESYYVIEAKVRPGLHEISLSFVNDYWVPETGEGRDLFVDRLILIELPPVDALYVWRAPGRDGTPITLAEAERLADFAVAEGIRTIYYDNYGCGRKPDCPSGAEQQDSATLAPIISLLHEHGLRVEALYTDNSRISIEPLGDPLNVVDYNGNVPTNARFDGIRLNIEAGSFADGEWDPCELFDDVNENGQWDQGEWLRDGRWPGGELEPTTPEDLEVYATAVTRANGLPVYVSIGHHWGADEVEPYDDANLNGCRDPDEPLDDTNRNGQHDPGEWYGDLNHNGQWDPGEQFDDVNENGAYDPDRPILYNNMSKLAYEHILGIVSGVDVQTAQDTAGTIVDITKEEVCYANSLGKPMQITIETYDVVTHLGFNPLGFNTFFEEGEVGMKDALAAIDYNAPCSDLLPTGFAYHFYRQSYGSPSLPRWAPDVDEDSIVDSVDPQPNSSSDDFSDVGLGGTTAGTITARGDQTLTIADATDPDDGVLITTAHYGGPAPAIITMSGGACITTPNVGSTEFELDAGDAVIVTCGSVTIEVNSGTVEIAFAASDGTLATTSLVEGNALSFEPTSITFSAPATNPDPVVVLVEGEELSLTPGEDLDFNRPPKVGEITAPVEPVQVTTEISASADFTDPDVPENHTAVWDWGDGDTTTGTVDQANDSVADSHTYNTPGVYTVKLTVTDNLDDFGKSVFQYVVVYDPEGGFVTGGGWINSPAGAYTPDPSLTGKASFGFVSKYKKGATVPTGQTEFQFHVANLNFHSSSYQWLVIAGPKAKFKGSGTINGSGDYGFMLTATDGQVNGGGGVDKFRIKIWDRATEEVVYDNQMGDADDADATDAIEGGSIVIHNNKK